MFLVGTFVHRGFLPLRFLKCFACVLLRLPLGWTPELGFSEKLLIFISCFFLSKLAKLTMEESDL